LLRVAFEELSLHRVALNVFDFNQAAIRCYQRAGFLIEGVSRQTCRVGNDYWDACVMSILEHEYRGIP
jgi:RimJ/RimL family protein N-acetyltransferase